MACLLGCRMYGSQQPSGRGRADHKPIVSRRRTARRTVIDPIVMQELEPATRAAAGIVAKAALPPAQPARSPPSARIHLFSGGFNEIWQSRQNREKRKGS